VPQQALATKLGFKRQAWAQLEASEARGAISLYSLRRAADALGYDLVYYLVPKQGASRAAGSMRGPHTPSRGAVEGDVAAAKAEELATGGKWAETELPTELR
jgi:transcriptional regulator with XRE-family HTH domain